MKTIHMGLNAEPDWIHADAYIRRWEAEGNPSMVAYWESAKAKSIAFRDEIKKTVESEGSCRLSWDCARSRHEVQARQWEEAMPEYKFEIGYNYECVVRKRGE